jgi:Ricin-type beta-trefoil lectin domain
MDRAKVAQAPRRSRWRGRLGTGAAVVMVSAVAVSAVIGASPASANPGGAVQFVGYANKCLAASQPADGAQLVLASCADGDLSQVWVADGAGHLMSFGLCMDIAWASFDNGAKVQLANCNGGPGQQFRVEPAGDLVNVQSNKCVDVRDWSTSDGTPLQQWDCRGQANQKWFGVLPARREAF